MPRSVWKGALSFGLVNVPVGLYPATSDKSIHFNQFEQGTSDRIRYKKVNERTGKEVPSDQIVKGVDIGGGEYVILSDEELAAAEPERTRQVEITDFVDLSSIDPVYYRTTYYLAPEGIGAGQDLHAPSTALRESGKVAIATLVMRNKEYLVAIRPEGDDALALETMFFPDEVRSPGRDLPALPDAKALSTKEISMAQLLIESMESEWDPDRFHDTHREKVEALVEAKRAGKEIVIETGPAPAKVVDLLEALSASVAAAAKNGKATASKPAAKKVATKPRTAAKKTSKESAASTRAKPAAARKAS